MLNSIFKKSSFAFLFLLLTTASFSNSVWTKSKLVELISDYQSGIQLGIEVGTNTRGLLSYSDYKKEGYSAGISFVVIKQITKLYYLEGYLHFGQNISGSSINANPSLNENYIIFNPIDVSLSLVREKYIRPNLNIYGGAGLGIIAYQLSYISPDLIQKNDHNIYSVILPITVAAKYNVANKIKLGIGYRYTYSLTSQLDGIRTSKNNSYSFAYIGIYYQLTRNKFSQSYQLSSRQCPKF